MNHVRASKVIKLRCKREGTLIGIQFLDWPAGKPAVDETTDSTIGSGGVLRTFQSRCFMHSVAPITTGVRKFAEVVPGSKILDFALGWYRVVDPGDTDLEARGIYDTIEVAAANRELTSGQAAATFETVEISGLDKPTFTINERVWVQSTIGEELLQDWDAIYGGLNLSMAILVRPQ